MIFRTGFVSNSSSSSFCITRQSLLPGEFELIEQYINSDENIDGWNMSVDYYSDTINLDTMMDNGAFSEWRRKVWRDPFKY